MRCALCPCLLLLLTLVGCAASADRSIFPADEPVGVAFSRSGGLAADTAQLIIASDGTFTLERDGRRVNRGTLSEAQQRALRARVADVRWDRVRSVYPDDRGRDAYAYALSVTSRDGDTRGVAVTDASSDQAPADLRELLRHLSGLTDELSSR